MLKINRVNKATSFSQMKFGDYHHRGTSLCVTRIANDIATND